LYKDDLSSFCVEEKFWQCSDSVKVQTINHIKKIVWSPIFNLGVSDLSNVNGVRENTAESCWISHKDPYCANPTGF